MLIFDAFLGALQLMPGGTDYVIRKLDALLYTPEEKTKFKKYFSCPVTDTHDPTVSSLFVSTSAHPWVVGSSGLCNNRR